MKSGQEFSTYALKQMSIKLAEETGPSTPAGAVGTFEESMTTRQIIKKYEGIERKKVVKPTGTGSVTIAMHMAYELYRQVFGYLSEGLIDGVYGYGEDSTHPPFQITALVLDENDNEMLIAYPRCVIENGSAKNIENAAEEVAQINLTVTVMPDDYGNGKYEALKEDVQDATVVSTWLTNFSPELVRKDVSNG